MQGSTPNLFFTTNADCSQMDKIKIVFSQKGEIILKKTLDDITIKGNGHLIQTFLTEEETLLFKEENNPIIMQIVMGKGAARYPSDYIYATVTDLLEEGKLE